MRSNSSSVGRRSRSPTTVAFGRGVEASGSFTDGGGAVRSATNGKYTAAEEVLEAKSQSAEAKADRLQGALASMRSKVSDEVM